MPQRRESWISQKENILDTFSDFKHFDLNYFGWVDCNVVIHLFVSRFANRIRAHLAFYI